jgi:hypothetical protein
MSKLKGAVKSGPFRSPSSPLLEGDGRGASCGLCIAAKHELSSLFVAIDRGSRSVHLAVKHDENQIVAKGVEFCRNSTNP